MLMDLYLYIRLILLVFEYVVCFGQSNAIITNMDMDEFVIYDWKMVLLCASVRLASVT